MPVFRSITHAHKIYYFSAIHRPRFWSPLKIGKSNCRDFRIDMMAGRKWKCWEDREGRVSTKRPFVGQGNPSTCLLLMMKMTTRVTRMMRMQRNPKGSHLCPRHCPHCVDHQYLIALQLINILSKAWNFKFNQTQIFEWDIWSDQEAFSNCHVWDKKSDTGFTPMFCHLKRYYYILILLFSYPDNLVIETLRDYKTGLNWQISTS